MNIKLLFLKIVFICLLANFASAEAHWKLPLTVDDNNTKVTFDVDTTWHVVYGKTSKLSGTVNLGDESDLLSVNSEIHFPVKSFDTGWGLRNDSLYEHMQVDKFPEVVLKTKGLGEQCTPSAVAAGSCKSTVQAELTICDVTKEIPLDLNIEDKGAEYLVSGKYSFKWAEYNVKDPSIIAASVDPVVRIQYSVTVPKTE